MSLLQLPVELRLQIYDFLPSLSPGRFETVAPNIQLTPAICRVNRHLRAETLPIHAQGAHFTIQLDDTLHRSNQGVWLWLQALGEIGLKQIRSVQLSRHWTLSQPIRFQGHVGFYIRLERKEGVWGCTTGTYPIAKDMRGMRLESVELLAHVTKMNVLRAISVREGGPVLWKTDFELLVKAMDIVAAHPISPHDIEQSEAGRKQRRQIWMDMEKQLLALGEDAPDQEAPRQFFTPY